MPLALLNATHNIRSADAHDRPFVFYIREVVQLAATFALVMVFIDVSPLGSPMPPVVRLKVTVIWAILMAGINLLITRAWTARRSSVGTR